MSDTFSQQRARRKREFLENWRRENNRSSLSSVFNQFEQEERSFKVDAHRYGNQRRAKAREKALNRRSLRHTHLQYDLEE